MPVEVERAFRKQSGGVAAWCNLERLGLVLFFVWLGVRFATRNWTTIWMDPEFTGDVGAIANRLAPGHLLYADGLHIPWAPLPFVLMHWLRPQGAVWLDESLLCSMLRLATLLVLYFALRRLHEPPVPFLSVLLAFPVFVGLSKALLYDAMVQFLVALTLLFVVLLSGRLRLVALGLACGTALLTKQSTGLFLAVGVVLALLLRSRGSSPNARVAQILLFGCSLIIATLLWMSVLRPWVDPLGMISDVFRTGAEPKGGPWRMFSNLARYAAQTLFAIFGTCLALLVASKFSGNRNASLPETRVSSRLHWAVLAGIAPGLAIGMVGLDAAPLFWLGFTFVLLTIAVELFTVPVWFTNAVGHAEIAVIVLCAAIGHSLSVRDFRWTYDNNPLIVIAIALILSLGLNSLGSLFSESMLPRVRAVFVVLVSVFCWSTATRVWGWSYRCTLTFGEIPYLRGAKLPERAVAFRDLATEVRRLAPDPQNDEVLVLPEDPNLESWWERKRPALTSAMIFVDEYWDRYVEEDVRRLNSNPPRLVLIGPQKTWREFSRQWQVSRGAERLIDEVTGTLLTPERYEKRTWSFERWDGTSDTLALYVRR